MVDLWWGLLRGSFLLTMATNHLTKPHYSNAIMLSREGKPMTTIGDDRVDWYVSRGLGELVTYPGYERAVRLTFAHKGHGGDAGDLIRMENRCVVCGADQELSLHHVVPYSVKRHYCARDKEHSRRQCVLLCEEHHLAIEAVNQRVVPNPYASIEGHLTWLNRFVGLYTRWLKKWAVRHWRWRAGGVKAINARYIDLFTREMKPRFLPDNWLQP